MTYLSSELDLEDFCPPRSATCCQECGNYISLLHTIKGDYCATCEKMVESETVLYSDIEYEMMKNRCVTPYEAALICINNKQNKL
jgi:hypothetical protein